MRWLLGLLVLLLAQGAHAIGTVPAVYCTSVHPLEAAVPGGPWCGSSSAAAVDAYAAALSAFNGVGYTGTASLPAHFRRLSPDSGCAANSGCYVERAFGSQSFSIYGGERLAGGNGSCPANSTGPSGGVCSCGLGYVPSGNACVPPDACGVTLAKPMGAPRQEFSVRVSSPTSVPSSMCTNGCKYVPRSTGPGPGVVGRLEGQYSYVGMDASQWVGLGVACTASAPGSEGTPTTPPQPDPVPLPPGKCPGTVNGVAVVVACDGTTTTTANSPNGAASAATSVGPSGIGTTPNTSSQDKETTCTETACVTTTTTEENNEDGTTTTTEETVTEDKGDFCAEHPGSPQCEGEEDPSDPCDGAPDRAACKNLGTLEPQALEALAVPLSIAPVSGFGPSAAACPAPQTAVLMGRTYSFSWQPFCDLATGIRPVVIALAWLTAAIGFIGLARKGT